MLTKDIGDYLQAQGIGTVGTDIFLGELPASPDNCIALFQYAGEPPDKVAALEKPGLQVRVRNKSKSATENKINSIFKALHGLHEQIINTRRYLYVEARQSPEDMGRDENGRAEYVSNFLVVKEIE